MLPLPPLSRVRLAAALALLSCAAGCGGLEVVKRSRPSPYTASATFSVEPIKWGAQTGATNQFNRATAASAGSIDPASVDLEQANRVLRNGVRGRGLDANLSDGDVRPVGAFEIRPALLRLEATRTGTQGGDDSALTVIGPGVRTTFEMSVTIVAPDGGTLDELRMSGTGPFYESLESCGARIATYLQGRGAGRVAAQATSETR